MQKFSGEGQTLLDNEEGTLSPQTPPLNVGKRSNFFFIQTPPANPGSAPGSIRGP